VEKGLLLQWALVEKGSLVQWGTCGLWKRVHLYNIGIGGKGLTVTMGTCEKGGHLYNIGIDGKGLTGTTGTCGKGLTVTMCTG
jgi:hypothetical protein